MLDLVFYNRENSTNSIAVSEITYEKLAKMGLSKVVTYTETTLIIEGDEYSLNVAELDYLNRKKIGELIEIERHKELKTVFSVMDAHPTIKEIRENLDYVKTLTEIYDLFTDENNIYFSYE